MAYNELNDLQRTARHVANQCRVDLGDSEYAHLRYVENASTISPDDSHKAWSIIAWFRNTPIPRQPINPNKESGYPHCT